MVDEETAIRAVEEVDDDVLEEFEEEVTDEEGEESSEALTESILSDDDVSDDAEQVEEVEDPVETENDESTNMKYMEPPDTVSETENKENTVVEELVDGTAEAIQDDVRFIRKTARDKVVDDPDSFKERMRRMRLMRHGYVILRTLSRDPETGDFIKESTLIPKKELPYGAVQCTNERGIYCLDTIKTSEWYQRSREDLHIPRKEAQFTASHAALYMQSNKIDNALITKWTDYSHIDKRKIILPIAAVVCILIFFVLRGL